MNFEDLMHKCSTGMKPSPLWDKMIKAYDENARYLHVMNDDTQVNRIPKILHQFWHGGPMPEKYKKLTAKWLAMHPDWQYILWDEQKVAEFGLTNKWMYDNMVNPSAKSDVVRYEVVYSYGGVYVDTDFLPCKNFDKLLYLDFFSGINGTYDSTLRDAEVAVQPSIFAASQGNKLLEKIIIHIGKQTTVPRSVGEIMTVTGPDMFSRLVLAELDKHPLSIVFPPTHFHSFPGQNRMAIRDMSLEETEKYVDKWIYDETYAMHLCYCSWQRQDLL